MQERVKRISGAQYQTLMLVFITCTAIDLSEFVFLTRPLVQLPALSFSLRVVDNVKTVSFTLKSSV